MKNGILLVNKPKDVTSRDIVNRISKLLQIKKVGHNGTLDPLATGVLVICIGKATKLNELLTSKTKEYIAEVTLGIFTDTLDITGNVLEEKKQIVKKEKLERVIKSYKKTYTQEVPKYSAVKVNGKKLYEYARNGEDVVLPKKEVTIYDISLLDYKDNKFEIYTKVSKGTYIRSLIRDICHELNTLGTMSELSRISQGEYNIKDTFTLEELENGKYNIIPIKDFLNIPIVKVNGLIKQKIINGQKLDFDYDEVLFTDMDDKELAIYKKEGKELKVYKMLYSMEKETIKS